jgi:hypothetical protein
LLLVVDLRVAADLVGLVDLPKRREQAREVEGP